MVNFEKAVESSKAKVNPEGVALRLNGAVIFLRIAKGAVYFLVFLLPFFFLPLTADALEFNKQALLFFLVLISLIAWLVYILTSFKLEINRSFINIAVISLLLATLLSTIFSVFRYGSFWGLPLPISTSFLSLLALVFLYFIVSSLFRKEEIPFLLLTLFVSGFLSAFFFVLQLFGKFILPFDFARNISFNTIGTANSLAIYLSLLLALIIPSFFFAKKSFKIVFGIFGLFFFFSLVLINFRTGWLVFLASMATLLALTAVSSKKTKGTSFVIFLTALLIIGLIFVFFQFSFPGIPRVNIEIPFSQQTNFKILSNLPVKSLILGSGPGNFFYDWAKYKPIDVNQTVFWNTRFVRSSSEFFDKMTGNGILGILALFLLIAACLKSLFTLVLKKMSTNSTGSATTLDFSLSWGLLSAFIGLVAAFLFYPANLSILFLFWLLIAFTVLLRKEKRQVLTENYSSLSDQAGSKESLSLDLQVSSIRAMMTSFFAVLVLILAVGLTILYSQKYLAEVRYYQGLKAWQKGQVEQSKTLILQAANLNPKMDLYWRDLSQISLFDLQTLLARTDLNQEEITSRAQILIADAVNSANQATTVFPNNVANWNIRGFIYRNMIGILVGAEDWALTSYNQAKELEPKNPYIFTEIGRIYLLKADLLMQQGKTIERGDSLREAQENFEKAIELKPDYAPAHFQIAMIYIREAKLSEAIDRLEATKLIAPFDSGLAFQLGLIYYNDNQFDKAKTEFERAVLIDQNYSNARYFLGLIYDREQDKNQAIAQFEKIEEFNPENEEVKRILSNLRAGRKALEGIVPGEPPIEEKPQEQLE